MPVCKCRQCQNKLTLKESVKKIINGKNAYFCDDDCYQTFMSNLVIEQQRKEKAEADRSKVYRLVCEIIGRKEIINGILWKEWQIWNKVADNEKIGRYLEENKDYLRDVISRLEDVEFNRIRYLSAILKNKLGDYKPKAREVEKAIARIEETDDRSDIELRINKKKKTVRRKGFAEMET